MPVQQQGDEVMSCRWSSCRSPHFKLGRTGVAPNVCDLLVVVQLAVHRLVAVAEGAVEELKRQAEINGAASVKI